jgi:hypothetical protein
MALEVFLMAKSRKSKRAKDDDEDDVIEAEPFDKEEKEYDKEDAPSSGLPKKGFFQHFGDGLKAAGAEAARYTKIGVSMAELEKLRFNLRGAYQQLGETITRCWDAAPDIGVSAGDSDVKDLFKRVSALRRQIREVEAKVSDLKKNGTPGKSQADTSEKK